MYFDSCDTGWTENWAVFLCPCRSQRWSSLKSSRTSSSTVRASISTALNIPKRTRPSTRCHPLKRAKHTTWLRLQVNPTSLQMQQTPSDRYCYSSWGMLGKCIKAFVFYCFLLAMAFTHHNMDKLSRIYPAGARTDSSNYNPVHMWNVGCQIGTHPSVHAESHH